MLACVAATVAVGGGVLIANSLFNLRTARLENAAANTQLAVARGMADEITTLAAQTPTASLGRRPTPGVVAQVGDALVLAGVPMEVLTSLDADENTASDAPMLAAFGNEGAAPSTRAQLRRQVNRLTLEPLSMPQLARFLDAWRANRPEWTITSIQISPQDGGSRPAARTRTTRASDIPGSGNSQPPLRIHLVMEAAYVDEAPTTTVTTPSSESGNAADPPPWPMQPR